MSVPGTLTGDAYSMLVGEIPPDKEPPAYHVHPHTDEMFYVADGEMTFRVGDRSFTASAGQAVFVPRGVPHTAWVSGSRPMRGVLVISPGDAKHVFDPAPEPAAK